MAKQNRNISFNTSAYKQHRFQAQHLKGLTSKYNARTTSYRISNTTSKQQHQQVKLWLNVKIFPIKINKFVNISNSPLFNFCSASFCVCVCVCEQQTPIFSNQKHFFFSLSLSFVGNYFSIAFRQKFFQRLSFKVRLQGRFVRRQFCCRMRSVWPDGGVKSSPNVSKSCPISSHSSFYIRVRFFKIAPINCQ